MIVRKNYSFGRILRFAGHHFVWLIPLVVGVALIQEYSGWDWVKMPFQPVALMGTAVAFYLGFKNNQSYERLWEARKIWGAIVNSSRAWGSYVKNFVNDQHLEGSISDEDLKKHHKRLIYRHLAWMYTLRSQLLVPTEWEHLNQRGLVGIYAKQRVEKYGLGQISEELTKIELGDFLEEEEYLDIMKVRNMSTQIIDKQGQDLTQLRKENLIDDFKHMRLQQLLYDFYEHQGKLERIKKFPLPRQYGSVSFIFVGIFIVLLPFGMVPLFQGMGHLDLLLSIPLTALVAWVYLVMELVGDYSENPFEGSTHDIPMFSICRTIEIDLKEMLGETDLPPGVESKNGILM